MWWSLPIRLLREIRNELQGIKFLLCSISCELQGIRFILQTPGLVTIKRVNDMTFNVLLPPPTAPDVVSGELTISIGSGVPFIVNTSPTDAEISNVNFVGNDNDAVTGEFRFIDDAGNRSDARTFAAVLTDTQAPPLPGEVGIRITGE